jgi:hypothetical protein
MLARGMGLLGKELPIHVWPGRVRCVGKNGFEPKGLQPIIDRAHDVGAKLVIMDSLFAIAAGLDMLATEAAEPLWATRNLPGVWLWAMHTPKGKPGYFGAQAIGAACGMMWNFALDDGDSKKPRVWTVGRKAEEFQGEALETFRTGWETEADDDGVMISGRIIHVDVEPGAFTDPRAALRANILEMVGRYAVKGLTVSQLFEGCSMRKQDRLIVLKQLVDSGAVIKVAAGRSMLYVPGTRSGN